VGGRGDIGRCAVWVDGAAGAGGETGAEAGHLLYAGGGGPGMGLGVAVETLGTGLLVVA
jgi:hypothetical protein